ncbi:HSP70/90 co-chaperone [Tilletia horrida]|nr:HSP70/90 co-chaperone [Tilletia horrida]
MAVIEEQIEEKASAPTMIGPSPPPMAADRDLDDSLNFKMPLLPDGTRATGTSQSRGKTTEDMMKEFDATPLFMRDLPAGDDSGDSSTNAAFEALQSLAFDGTPDEIAENFKGQGNEYFKVKRYKDAVVFYTKALDAHPTDSKLLETVHLNRAACNLELKNYGSVLRDTSAALKQNPSSSKAFYRAARALLSLRRLPEALDCVERASTGDSAAVLAKDAGFQNLASKVKTEAEREEKREKEAKERERRKAETERALKVAFLARGLWLETSPRPPDNPYPAHFDPDNLAPTSASDLPLSNTNWTAPDPIRTPLILPTFFLYPQHNQSDLISHFHEDETFGDRLDAMFPADQPPQPWDTQKREYVSKKLAVYASTRKRRLLKVGRGLTLRELMDKAAVIPEAAPSGAAPTAEEQRKAREERDGLIMRDGILSVVVLPKDSEAEREWVDKFKRERAEAETKEKEGKKVISTTRV